MSIKHLSTAHNCSLHGTDPASQVITFLLKMWMDLFKTVSLIASQLTLCMDKSQWIYRDSFVFNPSGLHPNFKNIIPDYLIYVI